jgi:diguanylate cyclase (GGDEF)-like protein/PAS domain S-box-containing protein
VHPTPFPGARSIAPRVRCSAGDATISAFPTSVHPVLSQQIATIYGSQERVPEAVQVLVALVDEAYRQADTEREQLAELLEAASRQILESATSASVSGADMFRPLFEANPLPMLVCSEGDHVVLAVNDVAAALLGGAPATLVGRSLDSLAPGIEQLLSSSEPQRSGVRRLGQQHWRRDRGPELVLDLASHPVRFQDRAALMILACDVTEWHRIREALEESEERYRLLVEETPEGIVVHREGKLLYVNPAAARMLGSAPPAELLGTSLWDRLPADAHPMLQSRLSGAGRSLSEYRVQRDDGTMIDVEVLSVPVRYKGRPAIQSVARDITARREAVRAQLQNEAVLRVAEQRARTTADRMRTVADAAAKLIAANSEAELHPLLREACAAVLPLDSFHFGLYDSRRDVVRFLSDAWERTPAMTVPVTGSPNEGAIRGRRTVVERSEDPAWDISSDGVMRMSSGIRTPILAGDEILGILVVQSCVPDLYQPDDAEVMQALAALAATALRNARLVEKIRRSEERLAYQAYHDPLTDLANRVRFQERVEQSLRRAEKNEQSIAVLFLDLDDFKTVNDSLGHQQGDRLLVAAAERLLNATRGSDTVARLGGDEFAVLLENVRTEADMLTVAARISHSMRSPFGLEGKEVFVAASIGIARGVGGITANDLLRNADAAMYAAKTRGKGQYAIFEPSMHAAIVARLELEADLRNALSNDQFRVYYQPIVSLLTGRLTGMEALLRWEHPARGMVLPREFVPFAEETGLIVPIGNWVLREATRQAAGWQRQFPGIGALTMTVNLSGRQLREASLPQDVRAALADAGLPGSRLALEITESVLMQDTEATLVRLQALKALGVSLAIDDFGTGYSSLGYLQRFPIDILKIDKSFVDSIASGDESPALARAVIALGDSLELRTVAEGVERAAQVDELRAMGCEFGQGYHFAEPMAPEDITEVLLRCSGNSSLLCASVLHGETA